MKDKVQKIREVIEIVVSRRLNLLNSDYFDLNKEVDGFTNEIMDIINSLQEEPVSDIDFEQELYKAFGQVKDFTLGMRIAKRFYEMGKNSQEPTSGDLGEYINELSKQFPEVSFAKLSRIAVRVAKWQKEQFEKERLKHCDELTKEQAQIESNFVIQHLKKNNRTPTFIDAIEYGIRLQRENMMKDAIDVEVKVDAGGYPYIDKTIELYDYDKDVPLAKEGEKYKVVLIKEY